MKKKHLAVSILVVLVVGFSTINTSLTTKTESYSPTESFTNSAIVRSDDFTDGDMDDWVTFALPDEPSNFTVIDGVVYSMCEDFIEVANHASSVAYGTWSFDIYMGRAVLSGVEFISSVPPTAHYSQYGYEFVLTPTSVQLAELYPTSDTSSNRRVADEHFMNLIGWHHVDITRDTTGYFCVYLNNTPILETVDTTVTSSVNFAFAFGANSGAAFDNVVLCNSVDIDLIGPRFLQQPSDQTIEEGEIFSYQINATDFSGISTSSWAINDTANFGVNMNGVISSADIMAVGTYGIEISVSDVLGNTRKAVFTLTVEEVVDPFTPFDLTAIIVTGGAVAIVVLIILVIFLKKRT